MTIASTALTTSTFDEVLNSSELPLVVEFWAEWCPPCRTIAPILEALATEESSRLRIVKINVDEHPELAARYDIVSIPTIIVFRQGASVRRLIGARGRSQLVEEIAESLR